MPRLLASSRRSAPNQASRGNPRPRTAAATSRIPGVTLAAALALGMLVVLVASPAAAATQPRLDRAVQGVAGTIMSVEYARDLAPGRQDLAMHAIAGGAISTVVGSLSEHGNGWRAGVIAGAGKELVNDALLGRGHAQFDDFMVTASAAVFSGCLSSRVAPLVYLDGHGAEVRLSWAF